MGLNPQATDDDGKWVSPTWVLGRQGSKIKMGLRVSLSQASRRHDIGVGLWAVASQGG